ncbi:hypothetical protein [Streptomyces sp. NPDC008092]|uniref:hypothetical protein n=1 Tax=Streptomyces sp. NPDC008092 TaxID=3364808 RepID=UPI0036F0F886
METNLPPGWRLEDPDEPAAATLIWEERRGPWLLRAVCPLWVPYEGPREVAVLLADPDADGVAGGVPVDVLRTFPLGEIKAQARSLLARVKQDLTITEVWGTPFDDLPRQCRTDADFAAWAGAWVLMRRISKTAPVKALVERTGVAQPTVSGRIATARKRGLIDEDGNLTAKGSAILNASPFEEKEGKQPT